MDTYSLAAAARLLRTSPPRVRRAVDRLGLAGGRDSAGVFHLTRNEVGELARELGVTPAVPGLSRTETQVLAALSRSPRGLASARDRAAGGSQSDCCGACAGPAFGAGNHHPVAHDARQGASQPSDGLPSTVRNGRVGGSRPRCGEGTAARTHRQSPHQRVPPHLRHLFWNTAPAQLDVATSAPYIARRLISTDDPDGLAWGAASLPASAWEHAAITRGLDPATAR